MKQKPVSFQKHYNEILPSKPQFKPSGWLLGPGGTYMATTFVPINKTFQKTETQQFDANLIALGKPGLYAEVGRYRMFQYSKLIKYIDYGVSYKGLRGTEKAEGQWVSLPGEAAISALEETSGNSTVNIKMGTLRFIENADGSVSVALPTSSDIEVRIREETGENVSFTIATTMTSPDIRAGVSLLIAALSAKGTSIIHNIEQIDRGYENIDDRLRAIGAKIERIDL